MWNKYCVSKMFMLYSFSEDAALNSIATRKSYHICHVLVIVIIICNEGVVIDSRWFNHFLLKVNQLNKNIEE